MTQLAKNGTGIAGATVHSKSMGQLSGGSTAITLSSPSTYVGFYAVAPVCNNQYGLIQTTVEHPETAGAYYSSCGQYVEHNFNLRHPEEALFTINDAPNNAYTFDFCGVGSMALKFKGQWNEYGTKL